MKLDTVLLLIAGFLIASAIAIPFQACFLFFIKFANTTN